eukprot:scaffold2954_cov195-Alexandrium_tamarense.AAC.5
MADDGHTHFTCEDIISTKLGALSIITDLYPPATTLLHHSILPSRMTEYKRRQTAITNHKTMMPRQDDCWNKATVKQYRNSQ